MLYEVITVRTPMRDSWYRGKGAQLKLAATYEIVNEDMPVQIAYRAPDPRTEFVALVTRRLKSLAGPADVLNRCVITSYSIHYTKLYEYFRPFVNPSGSGLKMTDFSQKLLATT